MIKELLEALDNLQVLEHDDEPFIVANGYVAIKEEDFNEMWDAYQKLVNEQIGG